MNQPTGNLRIVRKAPLPLGLYIRASRNDHPSLMTYLASGSASFSGVVFDATLVGRHQELLNHVIERDIDAVLDPRTQPMATVGGFTQKLGELPWGLGEIATSTRLARRTNIQRVANSIADFVAKHRFTQVIAPTHLIADHEDAWMNVDIETTNQLRMSLDRLGLSNVPIIYSLATSYATIRNSGKRQGLIERLNEVAAQSLWLNIDGFGSASSPTAATKYIEAAREFHSLDIPIVADHVGGLIGLALTSFGSVGGLAHGVTMGERFSTSNWRRQNRGPRFSPSPRVYFPTLDLMLDRSNAEKLFETGGRARTVFGCKDTECCPRGIEDMVSRPALHFLYQRTRELASLSGIPESIRAQQFLENHLRPTTDNALQATKLSLSSVLRMKASKQRKRLDDLRIVLGKYSRSRPTATFAKLPLTRRAREAS